MDDPLSGLRDAHLPAAAFPELLAAAAAWLALAIFLGLLLRLVAWKPPTRRQTLLDNISSLKPLDAGERLLGYAKIAREIAPDMMPQLRAALYARADPSMADAAERDLLRLVEAKR
jgi:hypothetical protein